MKQFVRGRWLLAIAICIAAHFSLGATCSPSSPGAPPSDGPPSPHHYSEHTPSATRDAHRSAIVAIRLGEWVRACGVLEEAFPPSERRALTDYLHFLCATHQPDQALDADEFAEAALSNPEPPFLLESERDAMNRYRAWIAAIQDELADEAERRGFQRPLPPGLRESRDLLARAAWDDRGRVYDATVYQSTRTAFDQVTSTLSGNIAMSELFSGVNSWTLDSVLYTDLSEFSLPPLPPMSLPVEGDL